MSGAERLASLDAALAAAAAEGHSGTGGPHLPEHGSAIDWEADFGAVDPGIWLTRSLSVRQLRALLQQHAVHSTHAASTSPTKPLVLLSLQELRLAALPVVRDVVWAPAHQAALGWGAEALQEFCSAQGLAHEGMDEDEMARRVACCYFAQKFELPASAIPPDYLGDAPPPLSQGSRQQGTQQAQHTGASRSPGRGGAARRQAPAVPSVADGEAAAPPASAGDRQGIPEGIELGCRLEWVGATIEARLELGSDSEGPQHFLLRYDEDLERHLSVIERAVVSLVDEGKLDDMNEGLLRWRLACEDSSDRPDTISDSQNDSEDCTSDFLDVRIGRSYAGPRDEAFRRDTLGKAAEDLLQGCDESLGFYGSRRRWDEVLDTLRLHPETLPQAAAARGAALLAGAAGRPPSRRELAALAAWLGRDREGLRASGISPAAAIEEEFKREWEELQELRRRGDADRLRALCRDAAEDFTGADSSGWTALHFAANLSQPECLKELLRAGASCAVEDRQGCTPLHPAVLAAASDQQLWRVKLLLSEGRDVQVDAVDREGMSALHMAVDVGEEECLEARLSGKYAEYLSCMRSLGSRVGIGLALGCPACGGGRGSGGLRTGKSACTAAGYYRVLMNCFAARQTKYGEPTIQTRGHSPFPLRQALLDGHADVNVRGREGDTPLHVAVAFGQREAVQLLLDRGADASLRNDEGLTPAELAAEHGDEELEELLSQNALLKRLQSGGHRGPRRLLSSLSSRNMPSDEPDLDADEACVVCMRRAREVILAPCGHRHLCKACTSAILTGPRARRSCPICKEKIASFVSQVFT
ncbi:hypothetical protein ABPG75_003689 [Micractinium tetrahymenae]